MTFTELTVSLFDTKVLAEREILLSLNSLTLVYFICSDRLVPINSEVLQL